MDNILKWGIIGYARIARLNVLPAMLRSSNSEFYAIASRDEEKLNECRKSFGCSKAYNNYEELLDDDNVQAVYIPLPNSLHKEWTIKAARKGKHILCEKPIALNSMECTEMIEECSRNNVKLMEAFMYRYTNRMGKVKEILDSGIIGDVMYINSSYRFSLQRESIKMRKELGGGSLYDVGCYPVNFIGMVTGDTPQSMSGEWVTQNGVDVVFSGVLKYKSGIICTINSGFNAYDRVYSEIIGTRGVMEIPDTFLDNPGVITVRTSEGVKEVEVMPSDRYKWEIEDFSDSVLNKREPMLSMEESLRNIRIIEKYYDMIYR